MRRKVVGIYRILCKSNNKLYIGSSNNVSNRIYEHRLKLSKNIHKNYRLQRAWNKYGADTFLFDVVCECEEHELHTKEQYYMDLYKSYDKEKGFNISDDARFSGRRGASHNLAKSVVCLNTGEKFEYMKKAIEKYPSSNYANIIACCKGELFSTGNSTNGTRLAWAYYDDYILMQDDEIINKVTVANTIGKGENHAMYGRTHNVLTREKMRNNHYSKRDEYINPKSQSIICIETGKGYESIVKCSRDLGISRNTIGKCLKNNTMCKAGYSFKYI